MELSSRVEYALLALLELSNRYPEGKPLKVSEIAVAQSIPERSVDQILMVLRRGGLVWSQRGVKGGYILAKAPEQIALLEIVTLLEGDPDRQLGEMTASGTVEKTVVIATWNQLSLACRAFLGSYTLQDLCRQRSTYQQVNQTYYI